MIPARLERFHEHLQPKHDTQPDAILIGVWRRLRRLRLVAVSVDSMFKTGLVLQKK
jgi:hypothetical protein